MILTPEKNNNLLATLVEFAYAEYGSALEMLAAAKKSKSPRLKVGYINHALDEYRHTELIFKVLNNEIKKGRGKFVKDYKFIPQNSVLKGYVDKNGFLIEKLELKKFVEFVYSNEYLAKIAFQDLIKRVKDKDSLKVINNIILEEENHADDSQTKLSEIMQDENRHWGHAKKFYEKKFPSAKLNIAFFRERIKNRMRVFYLKNFKFLHKIFDPIVNFFILLFGNIIKFIKIPNNSNKNLMDKTNNSASSVL
jgi:hypothetical protein